MTQEERKAAHDIINNLSTIDNLSVDHMTSIDTLREYIDSEDESAEALKEWKDKYKALEGDYRNLAEENSRITTAYRERWDAATTGTMANGVYVDKTVDRVPEYSYEKLMKGE